MCIIVTNQEDIAAFKDLDAAALEGAAPAPPAAKPPAAAPAPAAPTPAPAAAPAKDYPQHITGKPFN